MNETYDAMDIKIAELNGSVKELEAIHETLLIMDIPEPCRVKFLKLISSRADDCKKVSESLMKELERNL
jgi:hypothetical protein